MNYWRWGSENAFAREQNTTSATNVNNFFQNLCDWYGTNVNV